MNYWLIKSEPSTWSWKDQEKVKTEMWDGVRNYQARNYLMKMKKGDYCFFYHSVNEKKIIGIVEITKEHYPDPTDPTKKFVVVDVSAKKKLTNPVTLQQIKSESSLQHLSLIKQSRLSVMPIDKKSWDKINIMASI
ncbi:EVE domain-containing protein [Alphaproteobacteria bacterium]|nr:EVE domain-containing protein [Alphaproteobacteria bacterium]